MVIALAVVFAIVRLASVASGPWDWDEALFSLAVQGDYDVARHHPHPPGFPVYITLARLLAPVTGAFAALQTVVVVCGIALFPLMFLVARELGFGFRTSLASAALLAGFPNVVIFGGSAFSDVPSLTVTLAAVLLLLRGRQSPVALLGGSDEIAARKQAALAARQDPFARKERVILGQV